MIQQTPTSVPVATTNLLPPGTVLGEKYQIIDPIYFPIPSRTADFYRCQTCGIFYTMKVYRGKTTTSPGAKRSLKSISSPFVAKLVDSGTFNGWDFEVLPLYKNGTIHGKPLTIDYIKKGLVPCINQGLQVLHSNGIKHRNVKPVNIMLLDDFSGGALWDCGNPMGNELCGTLGRTPDYAAPETFRGIFTEESDYFSLGITLFELCCGYHPYQNASMEVLASNRDISQFPFPATVPQELRQLIIGLTYWDLSHQKEKTNPDRRWTFEEVQNWCLGKSQATPGELEKIPAFEFLNKKYRDIPLLMIALAKHWEEGKEQVFRGYLTGFFNLYCSDYSVITQEAETEYYGDKENGDLIFWRLIYQLNPDISEFYWKKYHFQSLTELGKSMLKALHNDDFSQEPFWKEILDLQLLSNFLQIADGDYGHLVDGVTALEITYSLEPDTKRNLLKNYYTMAFLLSGETKFSAFGTNFSTPLDLQRHLGQLIQSSYALFEDFCRLMIGTSDLLDPQLEAWLFILGYDAQLEQWKNSFEEEAG